MVQIQCTQARMCAQRSEIWERPRAKEKQERERAASGAMLVGKDHEVTAAKLGRSIPSLTLGIKLRPYKVEGRAGGKAPAKRKRANCVRRNLPYENDTRLGMFVKSYFRLASRPSDGGTCSNRRTHRCSPW